MTESAPAYPRPVQVRYPNGMEEVGIAIADDVVEVGPIWLYMELRDIIAIDDVQRKVTRITKTLASPERVGRPEPEGSEVTVRLRHRPV